MSGVIPSPSSSNSDIFDLDDFIDLSPVPSSQINSEVQTVAQNALSASTKRKNEESDLDGKRICRSTSSMKARHKDDVIKESNPALKKLVDAGFTVFDLDHYNTSNDRTSVSHTACMGWWTAIAYDKYKILVSYAEQLDLETHSLAHLRRPVIEDIEDFNKIVGEIIACYKQYLCKHLHQLSQTSAHICANISNLHSGFIVPLGIGVNPEYDGMMLSNLQDFVVNRSQFLSDPLLAKALKDVISKICSQWSVETIHDFGTQRAYCGDIYDLINANDDEQMPCDKWLISQNLPNIPAILQSYAGIDLETHYFEPVPPNSSRLVKPLVIRSSDEPKQNSSPELKSTLWDSPAISFQRWVEFYWKLDIFLNVENRKNVLTIIDKLEKHAALHFKNTLRLCREYDTCAKLRAKFKYTPPEDNTKQQPTFILRFKGGECRTFSDEEKHVLVHYAPALDTLSMSGIKTDSEEVTLEKSHELSLLDFTLNEFNTFYECLIYGLEDTPMQEALNVKDIIPWIPILRLADVLLCNEVLDMCFAKFIDIMPLVLKIEDVIQYQNILFSNIPCSDTFKEKWQKTRNEIFSRFLENHFDNIIRKIVEYDKTTTQDWQYVTHVTVIRASDRAFKALKQIPHLQHVTIEKTPFWIIEGLEELQSSLKSIHFSGEMEDLNNLDHLWRLFANSETLQEMQISVWYGMQCCEICISKIQNTAVIKGNQEYICSELENLCKDHLPFINNFITIKDSGRESEFYRTKVTPEQMQKLDISTLTKLRFENCDMDLQILLNAVNQAECLQYLYASNEDTPPFRLNNRLCYLLALSRDNLDIILKMVEAAPPELEEELKIVFPWLKKIKIFSSATNSSTVTFYKLDDASKAYGDIIPSLTFQPEGHKSRLKCVHCNNLTPLFEQFSQHHVMKELTVENLYNLPFNFFDQPCKKLLVSKEKGTVELHTSAAVLPMTEQKLRTAFPFAKSILINPSIG